MTRRRFFPVTRVQQDPGTTVDVGVQLRPEGPAQASDGAGRAEQPGAGECTCDVIGAGWLMSLTRQGEDAGYGSRIDAGYPRWGPSQGIQSATTYWDGTEWPAEEAPPYETLESDVWRCVALRLAPEDTWPPPVMVGVLQGRTLCGVEWALNWTHESGSDPAVSANGHRASTAGNMVWVYMAQTWDAIHGTPEVLTARAICGGTEVAQLTLEVQMPAAE